jgi:hypothetical protein
MSQPTHIDITDLINAHRETVTAPARLEENRAMLERYGKLFSLPHVPHLTAEEFRSFLNFSNNKHWWGIHRQGSLITSDMPTLREALSLLLDETQPIRYRLDRLFPKTGPNLIKGLGRAVVTPILLVSHPERYGVFNQRIEKALKVTGLWPEHPGSTFAERYLAVNGMLLDLARRYNLTLLQLDEILGTVEDVAGDSEGLGDEDAQGLPSTAPSTDALVRFGVEQHLEDFLVFNWEKTALARRYDLLEEDGDITGQQYATPVGRIDLLAREKDSGRWVVIELKKNKSGDAVVGQVLRYIGWVQENLAPPGEQVSGIIIAGDVDHKLRFALKPLPQVKLLTYQVQFTLEEVVS